MESFLVKLQNLGLYYYIKETPSQLLTYEFVNFFENNHLKVHIRTSRRLPAQS